MKNNITNELKKYADNKQKDFLSKLVPTIDKNLILGVKNPECRKLAKKLWDEDEANCLDYINKLPHKYLEEYILHGAILELNKNYEYVIKKTDILIKYFDNWATCDTYSPKIMKKHLKEFLPYINKWISDKRTYVIRFGIQMFMSFYLDDKLLDKNGINKKCVEDMTSKISKIRFKSKYKYKKETQIECPDKYYVDMMIAWYFATLLAKNYNLAYKYIKSKKLESWTHNMTIRKACESYRVSDKHKTELKKLIL